MKKNWKLIIGVLALVILIAGSYKLYHKLVNQYEEGAELDELQQEEVKEDKKEIKANDFTVYDVNGNQVKLSSFFGKPIVLNFWASWCGPCKSEMPHFQKAYETYGEEISFLMVNLTDEHQETQYTAKRYIRNQKFTFPVYYDLDEEAAFYYQVGSIPATYFINKNGVIVTSAFGALTEDKLLSKIERIR